jgi:hypothetical protein
MKVIDLFENDEDRIDQIDMVGQACKPFLSEIKGTKEMIWSGRKMTNEFVQKMHFQRNRRPANTPKLVHELFDHEFDMQHGTKFRSQAFFVTGDLEVAENYGTPGLLFPIGDFKYCWSPKVGDLYEYLIKEKYDLTVVKNMVEYGFKQQLHADSGSERLEKWWNNGGDFQAERFVRMVVKNMYQTNGLKEAISSKKEIMLHCPQGAYWINIDQDFTREEMEHMKYRWGLDVNNLDHHFQKHYAGYA